MMEKRFKITIGEFEEENISDTLKNIEITEISDMCTQMNNLYEENEQLKQELEDNHDFLVRASKRLGFKSLDHLLYTLDKGEITGYSTANWEKR